MTVTHVTPSVSAAGMMRGASRTSPAIRLASQNPPNEKNTLTKPERDRFAHRNTDVVPGDKRLVV